MRWAAELFHTMTAGDVMNRATQVLPQRMSVADAARRLLERKVRVAPVADALGRCVGVLSALDLLEWAANGERVEEEVSAPAASVWCDWQVVDTTPTRRDEVLRYMSRTPLLVTADTRLADIADALLDSRRTVVVVDEGRRPLGVISSRSLLLALASTGRRPETGTPAAAATDRQARPRQLPQPLGKA